MFYLSCGLIIYFIFAYFLYKKPTFLERDRFFFPVLCAVAFCIRLLCTKFYYGHEGDMSCFIGWSDMMFNNGPDGFYTSELFADYPPLYMYVLWLVGTIKNIFGITGGSVALLVKMPAIICDFLIAIVFYNYFGSIKNKRLSALLWLFNPAVILNSAVWGQVDSVYTVFVLISLLYAAKRKSLHAYIAFALAIMLKPQALFYAPVLLFALFRDCIYPTFDPKALMKRIGFVLLSVFTALLTALPFGLKNVIGQYIGTVSSYNYASVNAYNFWTMLGMNWQPLTPTVSFLSTALVILSLCMAGAIFFRMHGRARFFWCGGFICLSMFIFSVKMHERYAYPVIALMLFGSLMIKDNRRMLLSFMAVTLIQTVNCGCVLFEAGGDGIAFLGGAVAFAVYIYVLVTSLGLCGVRLPTVKLKNSANTPRITRADALAMIIITALYAAVALYNLGDMRSPQTSVRLVNEEKSYSVAENDGVAGMKLYIGGKNISEGNPLCIKMYGENGENVYETELFDGAVFAWEEYEFDLPPVRKISFSAKGDLTVFEAALIGKDGEIISAEGELFDESDLVPERISYRNSTYFDEIYHARTAYEFTVGSDIYEWTHPPLGKLIIALGIKLFGMNPFGWRIMGTLFGILMLPCLYIFAKRMFKSTPLASFASLLLAVDFMHFTQSRIATIDIYVTFFGVLMYWFMFDFLSKDIQRAKSGRLYLPLFLSGISFGLATACKWTGLYAGAGLAVIFFIHLFQGFKSAENKSVYTKKISEIIGMCFVFFLLIPILIYILSYIPFMRAKGSGLSAVWQNQLDMLGYHGNIDATHPYSSRWYEWAVMARPIWYYSGITDGTMREGISAFGNPLIWWTGIASLLHNIYLIFKKRCKSSLFLVIAYAAMLLPWVFVSRITFIYHYFPMVPFVCLMIANSAKHLFTDKGKIVPIIIFAIVAVILFALFYPVLSGGTVSAEYVSGILRWFDGWVLTAN